MPEIVETDIYALGLPKVDKPLCYGVGEPFHHIIIRGPAAEEFNYFFEHGEFMPIPPREARKAREDKTIERPAKKISMTGDNAGSAPAEAEAGETEAPASEETSPAAGAETPGDEK